MKLNFHICFDKMPPFLFIFFVDFQTIPDKNNETFSKIPSPLFPMLNFPQLSLPIKLRPGLGFYFIPIGQHWEKGNGD